MARMCDTGRNPARDGGKPCPRFVQPGERFCGRCRGLMLRRMRLEGYLTRIQGANIPVRSEQHEDKQLALYGDVGIYYPR